jgi:hypothetical protein
MGGLILAAAHQQGPVVRSYLVSPVFWVGVLLAVAVGLLFRRVLLIVLLLALIGSGLARKLAEALHAHSASATYVIILIVGIAAGLFIGQRRGLRLLGESDFVARVRAIHQNVTQWF